MTTLEESIARERRERNRHNRVSRDIAKLRLDFHFGELVRQLKALPVFRDCPNSIARTQVKLVFTARSQGGMAYGNRLARVRYCVGTSSAFLAHVTLHELVHCALPTRTGHDERFRLTLVRAAREAWGVVVDDPNPPPNGKHLSAYVLDDQIVAALEAKLHRGEFRLPPLPPISMQAIQEEAKARKEATIRKREEHAKKMLVRAERRLKLAKTIEKKWRQKVRRYERIAAKRGAGG